MIPRVQNPQARAADVTHYVTHDGRTLNTSARVEWRENWNMVQASPEDTAAMMDQLIADAPHLKRRVGVSARGRKLAKGIMHITLSWSPDEKPDRKEMMRAALESLQHLGLDRCMATVACHIDRGHPHVHVVVCRIDPDTGRALARKNDAHRLSRWAEQYEQDQGQIRVPSRVTKHMYYDDRRRAREQGQPLPKSRSPRRPRSRMTRDHEGQPVRRSPAEIEVWREAGAHYPGQKIPSAVARVINRTFRPHRRALAAAEQADDLAAPAQTVIDSPPMPTLSGTADEDIRIIPPHPARAPSWAAGVVHRTLDTALSVIADARKARRAEEALQREAGEARRAEEALQREAGEALQREAEEARRAEETLQREAEEALQREAEEARRAEETLQREAEEALRAEKNREGETVVRGRGRKAGDRKPAPFTPIGGLRSTTSPTQDREQGSVPPRGGKPQRS